jgi:hypothetical protein
MCVILTAETARLTATMIDRAIASNPDGNGLAWIQNSRVEFQKFLTKKDVKKLIASIPMPYVFHARIATCGGVRPSLCHPFPIGNGGDALRLSGRSKNGVLFHNGHWSEWKRYMAVKDTSTWSDSRLMAEIASEYGLDELMNVVSTSQRLAILRVDGLTRRGSGWSEYRPGVWASNRVFDLSAPGFVPRLSGPTRDLFSDDDRLIGAKGRGR